VFTVHQHRQNALIFCKNNRLHIFQITGPACSALPRRFSAVCACTWIYAFLIQNVSGWVASSTALRSGILHNVTLTVTSNVETRNVFWHTHRHNLWQMLYVGCSGEGHEGLEFYCHNRSCLLQTANGKYKYDSIAATYLSAHSTARPH